MEELPGAQGSIKRSLMLHMAVPDYEALRKVMQRELSREVLLEEAVATGKCLMNIYEILLYNRGDYDTI